MVTVSESLSQIYSFVRSVNSLNLTSEDSTTDSLADCSIKPHTSQSLFVKIVDCATQLSEQKKETEIQILQWLKYILQKSEEDILAILQSHLATRKYVITQEEPSIIDTMLLPYILNIYKTLPKEKMRQYKNVSNWISNMQKLPVYQKQLAANSITLIDIPNLDEAAEPKKDQGKKKDSKEKKAAKQPAAPIKPVPSMLDFKVGLIKEAKRHENADSLYVEQIECGEERPRTICSGLVNYLTLDKIENKHVIILANLKAANMRGVKSEGMVICGSNKADNIVELVECPDGVAAGDRVVVQGYESGQPEPVLNPKKKIWETIQPNLTSNDEGIVGWNDEEGIFRPFTVLNKPDLRFKTKLIKASIS